MSKQGNKHLKSKTAWLVTNGAKGHRVIAIGVAQALGVRFEERVISPPTLWNFIAPWGPVAFSEKIGKSDSKMFAKPWPDFVFGVGRKTVPYLRALKKKSNKKIFTVMLQDPIIGTKAADFIWVSEHDRLRGDNVITTLISPHKYTPEIINTLRIHPLETISKLPSPRIALFIGGNSKAFHYNKENIIKITKAIDTLKSFAGSLMITCSRRTPVNLKQAVIKHTYDIPKIFWDGYEKNPYVDFLAAADILVITADSANMVGEAAVTGKPVYVFFPDGGSQQINYFHNRMQEEGITRPLPQKFNILEEWQYEPVYTAGSIADAIQKQWEFNRV